MDVLFVLSGGKHRASTRFRVFNLLSFLDRENINYKATSAKKYSNRLPGPDEFGYALFMCQLLARAPQYDIIFLQRVPLPSSYLVALKKLCKHIIYDFDDAVYTAPQWEDRENQWKSLLDQTLQHSSLVIAGSPTLADYARQYCNNVVCQPTPIPSEKYQTRKKTPELDSSDTVTLGWIGNPQNLHYLTSIEAPLEQILDANEGVKFHVITAGDLPTTPLQDRDDVIYKTWTLKDELDLLEDVDIGLRPLFDDEWTRGKGGYTSVVQMMALGIPVVVTPVGMLTDIVEHGHAGYHANSPEEWIHYVSELIEDEEKRASFGQHAYEAVEEQQFWTEQRAKEWVNVFVDLCSE